MVSKEADINAMEKCIVLPLLNSATHKNQLIDEVAEVISKWLNKRISTQTISKGIKERESMSTTGFGNGFAIPHGKIADLETPILAIFSLENAAEWKSLDNQKVTHLFVILVPEKDRQNTHLTLLSTLSYHLIDEQVQEKIKRIRDDKEMEQYIELIFQKGKGGEE